MGLAVCPLPPGDFRGPPPHFWSFCRPYPKARTKSPGPHSQPLADAGRWLPGRTCRFWELRFKRRQVTAYLLSSPFLDTSLDRAPVPPAHVLGSELAKGPGALLLTQHNQETRKPLLVFISSHDPKREQGLPPSEAHVRFGSRWDLKRRSPPALQLPLVKPEGSGQDSSGSVQAVS